MINPLMHLFVYNNPSFCYKCLNDYHWSNICIFIGSSYLQGTQMVYKHFATLYFVFVFDGAENELAMLDLIQGKSKAYYVKQGIPNQYRIPYRSDWYCMIPHWILYRIHKILKKLLSYP